MYVTTDNYQQLDFDSIPIKEDWNLPCEKESRMHSIHTYPAKFPAFITTKAIQLAEANNIKVDTVADIFCGCGTVAYETVCVGKHFWGCDINPVATLIAEAKSQKYDELRLNDYLKQVINYYSVCVADKEDSIYSNDRIHYWFDDDKIDELLRLRTSIKNVITDDDYQIFFLCGFSNILRSCSRWLMKSIKPQIDPYKIPKDVKTTYLFQMRQMIKANRDNKNSGDVQAKIETVNFLQKEINGPFVDLVITSPPYVTSYEYADLHQLSTMWLGYTDDFRTFRNGTIGSRHCSETFETNIKKLNKVGLEIVFKLYAVDKSKTRSVAQYYIDMQQAVAKVYQMLNQGGACVFVIGNTELKGVKIDNAKHLTNCLFENGFSTVNVDRRKITGKILTPYRDQNGKFASEKGCSRKVYSEEFVIFARK